MKQRKIIRIPAWVKLENIFFSVLNYLISFWTYSPNEDSFETERVFWNTKLEEFVSQNEMFHNFFNEALHFENVKTFYLHVFRIKCYDILKSPPFWKKYLQISMLRFLTPDFPPTLTLRTDAPWWF